MKRLTMSLGALAVAAAPLVHGDQVAVDASIGAYSKTSGVTGNINSVGSDTMNNLMTFWGETFQKLYPNVKIQVEGKGSSTAPPALIAGTSQFGPMSRAMKPTEIDQFEQKYGYKPTQIRTAVDALGVFVNKDNPLASLSLEQLDAVFSKARRRGAAKQIATWDDAGLTGEWAGKPISLYGRNSASGTYSFFKEHVLKNGDYRDDVKEQPGSAAVVRAVATDRFAVGYSGIGYATSGVRAISLAEKTGEKAVAPSAENSYSGDYPLARFLFVYINRAPGKALDPLVREFTRLILSKEGQEIVVKDGYYPILASVATEDLKKVE